MNEADKQAFEEWYKTVGEDGVRLDGYDAWQAALEWRDSQVGEPSVWCWSSKDGVVDYHLVKTKEQSDALVCARQKEGDLSGSFAACSASTQPVAQINQQLVDELRPFADFDLHGGNLGDQDNNQPVYARDKTVLTVGDFKQAKAVIETAQNGGKRN